MSEEQALRIQIGVVHLNISHIERASFFFTEALGFRILEKKDQSIILGTAAQNPMLVLHKVNNPPPRRATTGLYHLAFLLPSRQDLARFILHLVNNNIQIDGVADHGVSESIYLTGPDDTGIEIYCDRSEEDWPRDDDKHLNMGTDELDLDNLLLTVQGKNKLWQGLPAETRLGHIHLRVSDLKKTTKFYTSLGFQLTQEYGESALFFATGGYHHQIGANTWQSEGADPLPPDTAGLVSFQMNVESIPQLEKIRQNLTAVAIPFQEDGGCITLQDPNGIWLSVSGPTP